MSNQPNSQEKQGLLTQNQIQSDDLESNIKQPPSPIHQIADQQPDRDDDGNENQMDQTNVYEEQDYIDDNDPLMYQQQEILENQPFENMTQQQRNQMLQDIINRKKQLQQQVNRAQNNNKNLKLDNSINVNKSRQEASQTIQNSIINKKNQQSQKQVGLTMDKRGKGQQVTGNMKKQSPRNVSLTNNINTNAVYAKLQPSNVGKFVKQVRVNTNLQNQPYYNFGQKDDVFHQQVQGNSPTLVRNNHSYNYMEEENQFSDYPLFNNNNRKNKFKSKKNEDEMNNDANKIGKELDYAFKFSQPTLRYGDIITLNFNKTYNTEEGSANEDDEEDMDHYRGIVYCNGVTNLSLNVVSRNFQDQPDAFTSFKNALFQIETCNHYEINQKVNQLNEKKQELEEDIEEVDPNKQQQPQNEQAVAEQNKQPPPPTTQQQPPQQQQPDNKNQQPPQQQQQQQQQVENNEKNNERDINELKGKIENLQNALVKENQENTYLNQQMNGSKVLYGDLIILKHIQSGKYLSLNPRVASEENGCVACQILPLNENSLLSISPSDRLRQNGQIILYQDAFLFQNFIDPFVSKQAQYVHVNLTNLMKDHQKAILEVNGSSDTTPFKARLFQPYNFANDTEDYEEILKSGQLIRFQHKQANGFLSVQMPSVVSTLPKYPDHLKQEINDLLKLEKEILEKDKQQQIQNRPATQGNALREIKLIGSKTADQNPSDKEVEYKVAIEIDNEENNKARYLWEIQKLRPFQATKIQWDQFYRIKHVQTGLYLSVKNDENKVDLVLQPLGISTNFFFKIIKDSKTSETTNQLDTVKNENLIKLQSFDQTMIQTQAKKGQQQRIDNKKGIFKNQEQSQVKSIEEIKCLSDSKENHAKMVFQIQIANSDQNQTVRQTHNQFKAAMQFYQFLNKFGVSDRTAEQITKYSKDNNMPENIVPKQFYDEIKAKAQENELKVLTDNFWQNIIDLRLSLLYLDEEDQAKYRLMQNYLAEQGVLEIYIKLLELILYKRTPYEGRYKYSKNKRFVEIIKRMKQAEIDLKNQNQILQNQQKNQQIDPNSKANQITTGQPGVIETRPGSTMPGGNNNNTPNQGVQQQISQPQQQTQQPTAAQPNPTQQPNNQQQNNNNQDVQLLSPFQVAEAIIAQISAEILATLFLMIKGNEVVGGILSQYDDILFAELLGDNIKKADKIFKESYRLSRIGDDDDGNGIYENQMLVYQKFFKQNQHFQSIKFGVKKSSYDENGGSQPYIQFSIRQEDQRNMDKFFQQNPLLRELVSMEDLNNEEYKTSQLTPPIPFVLLLDKTKKLTQYMKYLISYIDMMINIIKNGNKKARSYAKEIGLNAEFAQAVIQETEDESQLQILFLRLHTAMYVNNHAAYGPYGFRNRSYYWTQINESEMFHKNFQIPQQQVRFLNSEEAQIESKKTQERQQIYKNLSRLIEKVLLLEEGGNDDNNNDDKDNERKPLKRKLKLMIAAFESALSFIKCEKTHPVIIYKIIYVCAIVFSRFLSQQEQFQDKKLYQIIETSLEIQGCREKVDQLYYLMLQTLIVICKTRTDQQVMMALKCFKTNRDSSDDQKASSIKEVETTLSKMFNLEANGLDLIVQAAGRSILSKYMHERLQEEETVFFNLDSRKFNLKKQLLFLIFDKTLSPGHKKMAFDVLVSNFEMVNSLKSELKKVEIITDDLRQEYSDLQSERNKFIKTLHEVVWISFSSNDPSISTDWKPCIQECIQSIKKFSEGLSLNNSRQRKKQEMLRNLEIPRLLIDCLIKDVRYNKEQHYQLFQEIMKFLFAFSLQNEENSKSLTQQLDFLTSLQEIDISNEKLITQIVKQLKNQEQESQLIEHIMRQLSKSNNLQNMANLLKSLNSLAEGSLLNKSNIFKNIVKSPVFDYLYSKDNKNMAIVSLVKGYRSAILKLKTADITKEKDQVLMKNEQQYLTHKSLIALLAQCSQNQVFAIPQMVKIVPYEKLSNIVLSQSIPYLLKKKYLRLLLIVHLTKYDEVPMINFKSDLNIRKLLDLVIYEDLRQFPNYLLGLLKQQTSNQDKLQAAKDHIESIKQKELETNKTQFDEGTIQKRNAQRNQFSKLKFELIDEGDLSEYWRYMSYFSKTLNRPDGLLHFIIDFFQDIKWYIVPDLQKPVKKIQAELERIKKIIEAINLKYMDVIENGDVYLANLEEAIKVIQQALLRNIELNQKKLKQPKQKQTKGGINDSNPNHSRNNHHQNHSQNRNQSQNKGGNKINAMKHNDQNRSPSVAQHINSQLQNKSNFAGQQKHDQASKSQQPYRQSPNQKKNSRNDVANFQTSGQQSSNMKGTQSNFNKGTNGGQQPSNLSLQKNGSSQKQGKSDVSPVRDGPPPLSLNQTQSKRKQSKFIPDDQKQILAQQLLEGDDKTTVYPQSILEQNKIDYENTEKIFDIIFKNMLSNSKPLSMIFGLENYDADTAINHSTFIQEIIKISQEQVHYNQVYKFYEHVQDQIQMSHQDLEFEKVDSKQQQLGHKSVSIYMFVNICLEYLNDNHLLYSAQQRQTLTEQLRANMIKTQEKQIAMHNEFQQFVKKVFNQSKLLDPKKDIKEITEVIISSFDFKLSSNDAINNFFQNMISGLQVQEQRIYIFRVLSGILTKYQESSQNIDDELQKVKENLKNFHILLHIMKECKLSEYLLKYLDKDENEEVSMLSIEILILLLNGLGAEIQEQLFLFIKENQQELRVAEYLKLKIENLTPQIIQQKFDLMRDVNFQQEKIAVPEEGKFPDINEDLFPKIGDLRRLRIKTILKLKNILRFIQLLCDNCHLGFQNFFRDQLSIQSDQFINANTQEIIENTSSFNIIITVSKGFMKITQSFHELIFHDAKFHSDGTKDDGLAGLMIQFFSVLIDFLYGPCEPNQLMLTNWEMFLISVDFYFKCENLYFFAQNYQQEQRFMLMSKASQLLIAMIENPNEKMSAQLFKNIERAMNFDNMQNIIIEIHKQKIFANQKSFQIFKAQKKYRPQVQLPVDERIYPTNSLRDSDEEIFQIGFNLFIFLSTCKRLHPTIPQLKNTDNIYQLSLLEKRVQCHLSLIFMKKHLSYLISQNDENVIKGLNKQSKVLSHLKKKMLFYDKSDESVVAKSALARTFTRIQTGFFSCLKRNNKPRVANRDLVTESDEEEQSMMESATNQQIMDDNSTQIMLAKQPKLKMKQMSKQKSDQKGNVSVMDIKNQIVETDNDEYFENNNIEKDVDKKLVEFNDDQNNDEADLNSKEEFENFKLRLACQFYSQFVAQIEIDYKGSIVRSMFRIPQKCIFLSKKSREDIIYGQNTNSLYDKLEDLFSKMNVVIAEMKSNQRLARDSKIRLWLTQKTVLFQDISSLIILAINLLYLLFYEFLYDEEKVGFSKSEAETTVIVLAILQATISFLIHLGYFARFHGVYYQRYLEWELVEKKEQFTDFKGSLGFADGVAVAKQQKSIVETELTEFRQKLNYFQKRKNKFQNFLRNLYYTVNVYLIGLVSDPAHTFHLIYFAFSIGGIFYPILFSLLLLEIIIQIPLLYNVVQAIVQNRKQILFTLLLLLVIVYIYSFIAFISFRDTYINSETNKDATLNGYCHTLGFCFTSTLNNGLRSGGGIGDQLEQLTKDDGYYWGRYAFDLTFYIMIIILLLNLIFGIIIDAFAEMRDKRNQIEQEVKEKCFICGNSRTIFESKKRSFLDHIMREHNVFAYIYYILYLKLNFLARSQFLPH
eukprot:403355467